MGRLYAESPPVVIPEQLGNTDSYFPAAKSQNPLLVILQDAHSDYGAQKSLAEIVKYLILSY
ncbi:MAG TPA: hypothetical protein VD913_01535, partial [bacterium]|nr:hypothetical protein [bacterium]